MLVAESRMVMGKAHVFHVGSLSFNRKTAAGMAAGAATGYAASHYHSDSKYDVVDLGYDYHDVEG